MAFSYGDVCRVGSSYRQGDLNQSLKAFYNDLAKELSKQILEFGGVVTRSEILQLLENHGIDLMDDLDRFLNDYQDFFFNDIDDRVFAWTALEMCRAYCQRGDEGCMDPSCPHLHVCRHYLQATGCWNKLRGNICQLSHDFHSGSRNYALIMQHGLEKLSLDNLQTLFENVRKTSKLLRKFARPQVSVYENVSSQPPKRFLDKIATKFRRKILEEGGGVPLAEAGSMFHQEFKSINIDVIAFIRDHPDHFCIDIDDVVLAWTILKVCQTYMYRPEGCLLEDCHHLHICKHFMKGDCRYEDNPGMCRFGHDLYNDLHNKQLLRQHRLEYLDLPLIRLLFQLTSCRNWKTWLRMWKPGEEPQWESTASESNTDTERLRRGQLDAIGYVLRKRLLEESGSASISSAQLETFIKENSFTIDVSTLLEECKEYFYKNDEGNILPWTKATICKKYTMSKCFSKVCPSLHLCKHFMKGNCEYRDACKKSHDISGSDNFAILQAHNLQDLPFAHLRKLFKLKLEISTKWVLRKEEHNTTAVEKETNTAHILRRKILEKGGKVSRQKLQSLMTEADLQADLDIFLDHHRGHFHTHLDGQIFAWTVLRVCRQFAIAECNSDCGGLHVCLHHVVWEKCRHGADCKLPHSMDSDHNTALLESHHLSDLPLASLQLLLQMTYNTLNEDSGKKKKLLYSEVRQTIKELWQKMLEEGGVMSSTRLQELTTDPDLNAAEFVNAHPAYFHTDSDGNIMPFTRLRICREYMFGPEGCKSTTCQFLHACKHHYAFGDCRYDGTCRFSYDGICRFSHDAANSDNNIKLLKRFNLSDLTPQQLQLVIKLTYSTLKDKGQKGKSFISMMKELRVRLLEQAEGRASPGEVNSWALDIGLHVKDVSELWTRHKGYLHLHQDGYVVPWTNLRICGLAQEECVAKSCRFLHACKSFLTTAECKWETACKYGHDISKDKNHQLLESYGLEDLKLELLQKLFQITHTVACHTESGKNEVSKEENTAKVKQTVINKTTKDGKDKKEKLSHKKMKSLAIKLRKKLLIEGGQKSKSDLEQLATDLHIDNLTELLEKYPLFFSLEGDIVKPWTTLKVCDKYMYVEEGCTRDSCPSLHVCKHYMIWGECRFEEGDEHCKYSHDISKGSRNNDLLRQHDLEKLPLPTLRQLLQIKTSSCREHFKKRQADGSEKEVKQKQHTSVPLQLVPSRDPSWTPLLELIGDKRCNMIAIEKETDTEFDLGNLEFDNPPAAITVWFTSHSQGRQAAKKLHKLITSVNNTTTKHNERYREIARHERPNTSAPDRQFKATHDEIVMMRKLLTNEEVMSGFTAKPSLYCPLCLFHLPSHMAYRMHLQGVLHRVNQEPRKEPQRFTVTPVKDPKESVAPTEKTVTETNAKPKDLRSRPSNTTSATNDTSESTSSSGLGKRSAVMQLVEVQGKSKSSSTEAATKKQKLERKPSESPMSEGSTPVDIFHEQAPRNVIATSSDKASQDNRSRQTSLDSSSKPSTDRSRPSSDSRSRPSTDRRSRPSSDSRSRPSTDKRSRPSSNSRSRPSTRPSSDSRSGNEARSTHESRPRNESTESRSSHKSSENRQKSAESRSRHTSSPSRCRHASSESSTAQALTVASSDKLTDTVPADQLLATETTKTVLDILKLAIDIKSSELQTSIFANTSTVTGETNKPVHKTMKVNEPLDICADDMHTADNQHLEEDTKHQPADQAEETNMTNDIVIAADAPETVTVDDVSTSQDTPISELEADSDKDRVEKVTSEHCIDKTVKLHCESLSHSAVNIEKSSYTEKEGDDKKSRTEKMTDTESHIKDHAIVSSEQTAQVPLDVYEIQLISHIESQLPASHSEAKLSPKLPATCDNDEETLSDIPMIEHVEEVESNIFMQAVPEYDLVIEEVISEELIETTDITEQDLGQKASLAAHRAQELLSDNRDNIQVSTVANQDESKSNEINQVVIVFKHTAPETFSADKTETTNNLEAIKVEPQDIGIRHNIIDSTLKEAVEVIPVVIDDSSHDGGSDSDNESCHIIDDSTADSCSAAQVDQIASFAAHRAQELQSDNTDDIQVSTMANQDEAKSSEINQVVTVLKHKAPEPFSTDKTETTNDLEAIKVEPQDIGIRHNIIDSTLKAAVKVLVIDDSSHDGGSDSDNESCHIIDDSTADSCSAAQVDQTTASQEEGEQTVIQGELHPLEDGETIEDGEILDSVEETSINDHEWFLALQPVGEGDVAAEPRPSPSPVFSRKEDLPQTKASRLSSKRKSVNLIWNVTDNEQNPEEQWLSQMSKKETKKQHKFNKKESRPASKKRKRQKRKSTNMPVVEQNEQPTFVPWDANSIQKLAQNTSETFLSSRKAVVPATEKGDSDVCVVKFRSPTKNIQCPKNEETGKDIHVVQLQQDLLKDIVSLDVNECMDDIHNKVANKRRRVVHDVLKRVQESDVCDPGYNFNDNAAGTSDGKKTKSDKKMLRRKKLKAWRKTIQEKKLKEEKAKQNEVSEEQQESAAPGSSLDYFNTGDMSDPAGTLEPPKLDVNVQQLQNILAFYKNLDTSQSTQDADVRSEVVALSNQSNVEPERTKCHNRSNNTKNDSLSNDLNIDPFFDLRWKLNKKKRHEFESKFDKTLQINVDSISPEQQRTVKTINKGVSFGKKSSTTNRIENKASEASSGSKVKKSFEIREKSKEKSNFSKSSKTVNNNKSSEDSKKNKVNNSSEDSNESKESSSYETSSDMGSTEVSREGFAESSSRGSAEHSDEEITEHEMLEQTRQQAHFLEKQLRELHQTIAKLSKKTKQKGTSPATKKSKSSAKLTTQTARKDKIKVEKKEKRAGSSAIEQQSEGKVTAEKKAVLMCQLEEVNKKLANMKRHREESIQGSSRRESRGRKEKLPQDEGKLEEILSSLSDSPRGSPIITIPIDEVMREHAFTQPRTRDHRSSRFTDHRSQSGLVSSQDSRSFRKQDARSSSVARTPLDKAVMDILKKYNRPFRGASVARDRPIVQTASLKAERHRTSMSATHTSPVKAEYSTWLKRDADSVSRPIVTEEQPSSSESSSGSTISPGKRRDYRVTSYDKQHSRSRLRQPVTSSSRVLTQSGSPPRKSRRNNSSSHRYKRRSVSRSSSRSPVRSRSPRNERKHSYSRSYSKSPLRKRHRRSDRRYSRDRSRSRSPDKGRYRNKYNPVRHSARGSYSSSKSDKVKKPSKEVQEGHKSKKLDSVVNTISVNALPKEGNPEKPVVTDIHGDLDTTPQPSVPQPAQDEDSGQTKTESKPSKTQKKADSPKSSKTPKQISEGMDDGNLDAALNTRLCGEVTALLVELFGDIFAQQIQEKHLLYLQEMIKTEHGVLHNYQRFQVSQRSEKQYIKAASNDLMILTAKALNFICPICSKQNYENLTTWEQHTKSLPHATSCVWSMLRYGPKNYQSAYLKIPTPSPTNVHMALEEMFVKPQLKGTIVSLCQKFLETAKKAKQETPTQTLAARATTSAVYAPSWTDVPQPQQSTQWRQWAPRLISYPLQYYRSAPSFHPGSRFPPPLYMQNHPLAATNCPVPSQPQAVPGQQPFMPVQQDGATVSYGAPSGIPSQPQGIPDQQHVTPLEQQLGPVPAYGNSVQPYGAPGLASGAALSNVTSSKQHNIPTTIQPASNTSRVLTSVPLSNN